MIQIPDTAVTHGGKFHADDVFSAALLTIINPKITVKRIFEIPENFDGIVFDIGFGRFDHHQQDSEKRENGVPYAAFGLLWREYGARVIAQLCLPGRGSAQDDPEAAMLAAHFDETFIQPLDEDDNTGSGNQLAGVIGSFNPSWDSAVSADDCFGEAAGFASVILRKKFEGMASIRRARSLVESALAKAKDKIVVLPQFAPWKSVLAPSPAEFVVYPSQRGGYSAQVVPDGLNTSEPKRYFPEEWAGRPAAELPSISGVKTLKFCHKGRFLISAESLEDVLKACRAAQGQSPAAGSR